VIPQALVDHEVAHTGIDDLRVVASMHERKALMADLSEAFVALPGGIGTLEELIEVLTWTKLGLHAKPSALLNIGGYYDALIRFLDHAVEERFLMPGDRELLLVADRPDALISQGLVRLQCAARPCVAGSRVDLRTLVGPRPANVQANPGRYAAARTLSSCAKRSCGKADSAFTNLGAKVKAWLGSPPRIR